MFSWKSNLLQKTRMTAILIANEKKWRKFEKCNWMVSLFMGLKSALMEFWSVQCENFESCYSKVSEFAQNKTQFVKPMHANFLRVI